MKQQAGAEGQAQRKLRLDFTPIFCRFGFSGMSFYFIGLIQKNLVWYSWFFTFQTFGTLLE